MTKKIWVSVSSENQGFIERCDACGVTQPDSASAFRQLHEEDCPIAPGPTDLLERIEGLSKPRSEKPDEEIENERIRKVQEAREKQEQAKRTAERIEWERKLQEGKVIATAQSSDPDWKIKEQIGFLESAIKGRNLELLRLQIDWSTQLISNINHNPNYPLCVILQEKIKFALKVVSELEVRP